MNTAFSGPGFTEVGRPSSPKATLNSSFETALNSSPETALNTAPSAMLLSCNGLDAWLESPLSERACEVLPASLAQRVSTGNFHLLRGDAIAAGYEPALLSRWCRSGYLTPVGHGVYVIAMPWGRGVASGQRRVITHVHTASAIAHGLGDAHLVGRTAALAHGFALAVPGNIELARTGQRRSRRDGVLTRSAWGSGDQEGSIAVGGVQPVVECLIEISAMGFSAMALGLSRSALRAGLVTEADVYDAAVHYGARAGAAAVRQFVEHTFARTPTASHLHAA